MIFTQCESITADNFATGSKQPIRTRYLGHVTGYQPIRDQYFLTTTGPPLVPPPIPTRVVVLEGNTVVVLEGNTDPVLRATIDPPPPRRDEEVEDGTRGGVEFVGIKSEGPGDDVTDDVISGLITPRGGLLAAGGWFDEGAGGMFDEGAEEGADLTTVAFLELLPPIFQLEPTDSPTDTSKQPIRT
eukprot:sb/3471341/